MLFQSYYFLQTTGRALVAVGILQRWAHLVWVGTGWIVVDFLGEDLYGSFSLFLWRPLMWWVDGVVLHGSNTGPRDNLT